MLLRRYLNHPELDWNHYFDQDYTYEELNQVPWPEVFERLSIQGVPLLYIYFMHGIEGLQDVFEEIENQRLTDENWMEDGRPTGEQALERFIRILAEGLQLDVSPYLEYWKYPISNELRTYLSYDFH